MRSYIPAYDLQAPPKLSAVLDLLASEPHAWKPFAGGTDLMVLLEAGKLPHKKYLSIWGLPELRGIEVTPEHIFVGATTTYSEIRRHEILVAEFPLLCSAAAETGSIATQNRGTLGGNIANASPAADSPPALIVYDAEIELISSRGARTIPYKDFHTAYKQSQLRADELIGRIRLPRKMRARKQHYRKVGTRRAQAISKVCFAGVALIENGRIADVRLAFGSIAPTVIRAAATERLLREAQVSQLSPALTRAAQDVLGGEVAPIDDMRSTARYRRRVAQNLLGEFLEKLSA